MCKVDRAALAASKHSALSAGTDQASRLVCLALTLAMVALACRIYSVW
jgi:hypothetical protein